MTVGADGRLMLPDGMSYRVLVLPEIDRMTLPVIKKIHDLVMGGATIVGQKPVRSPSLADYPKVDDEVQSLAAELWGDLDGVTRNRHFVGKRIGGLADAANRNPGFDSSPQRFRIQQGVGFRISRGSTGAQAMPIFTSSPIGPTGRRRWKPASELPAKRPNFGIPTAAQSNRPIMKSKVAARRCRCIWRERESVFVVFRRPAAKPSRTLPKPESTVLSTLDGSWDVAFPPHLGVPESIQIAKLDSWTANADEGVKYFSGTATYSKTFPAARKFSRERQASCARSGRRKGYCRDYSQRPQGWNTLEAALSN